MWLLLDKFQDIHRNIEIDLFTSERRLEFIEDGIDVALRIGDIDSQSAVARKLTSYRHRLVASPGFLQGRSIKSPAEVLSLKCAAWSKQYQSIKWTLGEETLEINPYIRANDYNHMRYLSLQGKCITELPPFLCKPYIDSGELIEVLPHYPMPEQSVNLLYPSRKSVSRITRVFIDYCVTSFKGDVLKTSSDLESD